jgi:hypothetical protein
VDRRQGQAVELMGRFFFRAAAFGISNFHKRVDKKNKKADRREPAPAPTPRPPRPRHEERQKNTTN